MNLRIILLSLAVLVMMTASALAADGAAGALASARELLHAGRYAEASALADTVIGATTDSDILCGAVDVIIACRLATGDFEGAAQAAQSLKSRIADAETLTYLDTQIADVRAKQASYERTVRDLEQVLSAHPYDETGAEAAYRIGAARLFRGRLQEALTAYDRVVSDFPTSDWALQARLDMAAIQRRMAKPSDAEALYRQVISTAPQSAYAAQAVAGIKDLWLEQGSPDSARQRMTELAAQYPDTEISAMAEYCQGELLLVAGKLAEGMAALDKVVAQRAGTVAAGAALARIDSITNQLMDAADTLRNTEKLDEAVTKYEEVIALTPRATRVAGAHQECAWIRTSQGRLQDAIAHYKAIIDSLAPSALGGRDTAGSRAYALLKLGDIYFEQSDIPAAAEQFSRILREHAEADEYVCHAYQRLASCYVRMENVHAAIDQLDIAMSRYGGTEPACGAVWYKAQLLRGAGKLDQARRTYQQLVDVYANVPRCGALVDAANEKLTQLATGTAAPVKGGVQ